MKVGIMSPDEYTPKKEWTHSQFESLQTMPQILGNENQDLRKSIIEEKPGSIQERAITTGRKSSTLSRTIMTRHGIVDLSIEK